MTAIKRPVAFSIKSTSRTNNNTSTLTQKKTRAVLPKKDKKSTRRIRRRIKRDTIRNRNRKITKRGTRMRE